LLIFATVYSIPQGPCGPCGTCGEVQDVCCEKPAPGPFAFSYLKDKGLACPCDFYFFGEFLYMQAKEDGLEFAISYTPCDPDTPGNLRFPITNGQVENYCSDSENWDWNPGFRFGLGFDATDSGYFVEGSWTYLHITDFHSTSLAGNGVLVPLWMVSDPFRVPSQVYGSTRWEGWYNTLDLHLAFPYHVSRYYTASPHAGMRVAIIDQYHEVHYNSYWNGSNDATMIANNDFCGIGARVGVDQEFMLACNAGFYANFSASMIYGKFNVDQTFRGGSNDDASAMNSDLDFEVCDNITNFDIQLGLFWGLYFCDMKYHLGMRFGYEFHYWHDQNQLRRWTDPTVPVFNDAVSRGDLTLNGISFRLQFDF
jgi:hypothetical protein